MNRGLFYSLITSALLFFCCMASPALADILNAEDITSTISGKTLSGYNMDDRQNITWYFAADGVAKLRKKDITWAGKWRIDDNGRLCVQFKDPYSGVTRKEGCRTLAREDGKLYMYGLKKDGTRAGDTMSVEKIEEGNTTNL